MEVNRKDLSGDTMRFFTENEVDLNMGACGGRLREKEGDKETKRNTIAGAKEKKRLFLFNVRDCSYLMLFSQGIHKGSFVCIHFITRSLFKYKPY